MLIYRFRFLGIFYMQGDFSQYESIFSPINTGANPGPNMPGLPGPSEPTALISAVPDSREMLPNSPSLSEEFPFLRMGSAEFRELVATLREPPLMEDSVRREELESFLHKWVEHGFEPSFNGELVNLQFRLELKLEYALREEGFSESSIMETRCEWRRAAFTLPSREKLISIRALKQNLLTKEIRESAAYKRIISAASHGQINLRKEPDFGQLDQILSYSFSRFF
uniref:Uncharacterized protein orf224b n=1 Tax=Beta vulgaris subsp. maritima TaxID=350892 RepID=E8ZC96_BETVM|nr:hypothetical protein [Beta vulgaris subsp. maritima]